MPHSTRITIEEVSQHFHMPINDVSIKLGICATVLKKICRRNGIKRWPHRKIKSLENMIQTLQNTKFRNEKQEMRINMEIEELTQKKEQLIKSPSDFSDKIRTVSKRSKRIIANTSKISSLAPKKVLQSELPEKAFQFPEETNEVFGPKRGSIDFLLEHNEEDSTSHNFYFPSHFETLCVKLPSISSFDFENSNHTPIHE